MENVEVVRRLTNYLKDAHVKVEAYEEVSGFLIYEFLTELEDIQNLVIDLLNIPPGDLNEELFYKYIRGEAEYNFDEMLSLIKEAWELFDFDDWNRFCDEHELMYGDRP